MKWPWVRHAEAQAEAAKAKTEYEWAVQNRTTVSAVLARLTYHGNQNGFVEKIQRVARGH
jgi:hypothetical protein